MRSNHPTPTPAADGEASAIADEVERIVFAFDAGDSRRDAVKALAQRVRALRAQLNAKPEAPDAGA